MDVSEIYETLKEKIIWLELKPESTFNLVELAKSYGVSRYPITMALNRLEFEDLVVRNGTHYMISPLSLERIKENVEIRLTLEVQANVLAMKRIRPEEMSVLEQLQNELSQLKSTVSTKQVMKLDLKFHQTIFKASKNHQLAQILDRIIGLYLRFWLSVPYETEPQMNVSDTLEIIDAIKKKDEDTVREASIKHIKSSFMGIMDIS